MRKLLIYLTVTHIVLMSLYSALAQNPTAPIIAKPEEQARIKPIITDLKKADQARMAKVATLPEAQAVRDAEAALTKAREALEKAAANLPETIAWKESWAKMLDVTYDIQAKHGLSSREYQPSFNEKDELTFVRSTPPKP